MAFRLPNTVAFFLMVSTFVLDFGIWLLWDAIVTRTADELIVGLGCILIGGVIQIGTARDMKEYYGR